MWYMSWRRVEETDQSDSISESVSSRSEENSDRLVYNMEKQIMRKADIFSRQYKQEFIYRIGDRAAQIIISIFFKYSVWERQALENLGAAGDCS